MDSQPPRAEIVVRIDRRALIVAAAAVLLVSGAGRLASEILTLSTTYPSPVGVYTYLITTGGAGLNTVLNRSAGNTILVPATNASGKVGIGMSPISSKLEVAGSIRLGNDDSTCGPSNIGAVRFRGGPDGTEVCDGSGWDSLSRPRGSWCGIAYDSSPPCASFPNHPTKCHGEFPNFGCPIGYNRARIGTITGSCGPITTTWTAVTCVKGTL